MTESPSKPVRIQRKRVKGFDLQAESRAINGLDCVYVGRPTKWGNPIPIEDFGAALAVRIFRKRLLRLPDYAPLKISRGDVRRELRGKNLACFCAPNKRCHADILLEIANAEDEILHDLAKRALSWAIAGKHSVRSQLFDLVDYLLKTYPDEPPALADLARRLVGNYQELQDTILAVSRRHQSCPWP